MIINIESKDYELEFEPENSYIRDDLRVAYSDDLAFNFMPILLDPQEFGINPFPPDFLAYRLILDLKEQKLCILYEVYWRRQECSWQGMYKTHDHDYEQIQVHFNLQTGKRQKVVISSVGPVANAGHGVEIFSNISKAECRTMEYKTSSKKYFPWGGTHGEENKTQVREIPINKLLFEQKRPFVIILNCYHAFVGMKKQISKEKQNKLDIKLERLDRTLLDKWYYGHSTNKFGHDISKPFEEPYVMYYPPPEDWLSRFVYELLWIIHFLKNKFT